MNYLIEECEDQIIAELKLAMPSTAIATHAGQITQAYFEMPELREGLIAQLPSIFIQYQGKSKVRSDTMKSLDVHLVRFRLFVAAQSLRLTKESQRSVYAMLRNIYDALHGHYFNYSGVPSFPSVFTSTQIPTAMNQQMPLTEADSGNENLIVCMPRIVVYQTDYVCQMIA